MNYSGHQVGRNSKGQPVIGIFKDDELVERLTLDRIVELYKQEQSTALLATPQSKRPGGGK